nr:large subunit ribosomal protein 29 [Moneuplotes crassus]prf//2104279A ribosomal protein L29 [Moneuplotes crassus]|mmetsp:Transcript_17412/g.17139  ORF Transcript_17412/g.17139 Transcript_17412/m.17139 type:complete len:148 (+) Transcript_17412:39-482(+)|eukprot:CAMPEP_0196995520 /NCGR_PEP_ID=MMETSP1380-20130617/1606_1 /TAXON_ID=5936 /ORGANISM="Euplotes crassus, Strain CT5" /LENGTH=147 /DNA_ID=CAMNT_0042411193 /DNA_START=28 /DNA_END=471 /DNA_ORIENTATION=+
MTHSKRNTRKLRGHVSHGHGRVGKHRKHPGGRGMAGPEHHHRINVFKYHPGHIGKHGMRHFHLMRNQYYCPSINLSKLWSLVTEEERQKAQTDKSKVILIDVVKHGYYKVLGKGLLPEVPLVVKAKLFTPTAEKRIKQVGGACVLRA